MSLYIHSENQKLLWNSIKTFPLFNICFNNEEQKMTWFKGIIRIFYEQNPKTIINTQLSEINRKTIIYMLKDLKAYTESLTASNTVSSIPSHEPEPREKNGPLPNTAIGMPYISNYDKNIEREERIKSIESRLVEKQHEMDSILHRPTPPEIDFRMVEKDDPIINIDELLQKHIRERELYQEIPQQIQQSIQEDTITILDKENKTQYNTELSYKLDKLIDMIFLIDDKLTKFITKSYIEEIKEETIEEIKEIIVKRKRRKNKK